MPEMPKRPGELRPEMDRRSERLRYDAAAQLEIQRINSSQRTPGWTDLPTPLRRPYEVYGHWLDSCVEEGSTVLEIGAGTGLHTTQIPSRAGRVLALDISVTSLEVCALRARRGGRTVLPLVGNMEKLPLADQSADVVAAAGSLSYGSPELVDAEMLRVLAPGGSLVIVDSLNHNTIYRWNRWLHYRRGHRTLSTLKRMPTIPRLHLLASRFETSEVFFHGSYVFTYPFFRVAAGENLAARATDWLESRLGSPKLAFKFVLRARGLIGNLTGT